MEPYLLELVKIRNIKSEVANKRVGYDFIPGQTCFCHVEVAVDSFDPRFWNQVWIISIWFSKLSNILCKAPMCWCVAFKSQFLRSNDQSEPLNVIYISKFCRTSNLYFFRTSVLFFQIRRKLIGFKNSEPSNHYSFSVQKSNKVPNLSSYRFDKCAIVLSKAHQCAVTLLLDLDF